MHIQSESSATPTLDTRAIGVVGSNTLARLVAARLASSKRRVLHHVAHTEAPPDKLPGIERAITTTDLALDSRVVLNFISDANALREFLVGTSERVGLGAEMQPGSVLVDFAIKPPRQSQALLGVLGTRGIAVVDAAFLDCTADTPRGILLGGFPDAVDDVRDVIAAIAPVTVTGPLGSAHTAAILDGVRRAALKRLDVETSDLAVALGFNRRLLDKVPRDFADGAAPDASAAELHGLMSAAQTFADAAATSSDVIRILARLEWPDPAKDGNKTR